MDSKEFEKYLISLRACNVAMSWASGKSWREVYDTCHRGDWLLWLYRRSKCYDFQKLTLAKGLCANTVRHLMKDERSLKAVDAAIAFGKGEISRDELNAAAYDAYDADADAANDAAANAAYAADANAAYAADADAANDAAANAYAAAYAANDAAANAAYAAAYADADAAAYTADAAYAAYAADAAAANAYAAAYAYAAIKENQQKTADIVREVLPFDIWVL